MHGFVTECFITFLCENDPDPPFREWFNIFFLSLLAYKGLILFRVFSGGAGAGDGRGAGAGQPPLSTRIPGQPSSKK